MITIPKFILKILPQKFLNSSLFHHIYYKHTKEHKKLLEDTKNRVLSIKRNMQKNNNKIINFDKK